MTVVIDSSVAACWALPDETSSVADIALDLASTDGMVVPALFAYEFRNVLVVNERRGHLNPNSLPTAMAKVEAIPTEFDSSFDGDRLLEIARSHRLSVCDAAYVELALRTGLQLATLDRKLAEAAALYGVAIVQAGN